MTSFALEETVAILERTPATLDALLRGAPAAWTRVTEGPDTWSVEQIVGHLIHGERTDWIPRLRTILDHGEARTFEPFDRFAMLRDARPPPLAERLAEFARLRGQNLETLRALALDPDDLDRAGRHPDFGTVTARQLLATWAVHDLSHLAQIARVMARRYRTEVGPWSAYLPILGRPAE